ncbi:MerR family transcriptional regulator [Leucobacter albus]|uniref:MerR family transcriptional regulator n=1 Tax=Leucobacter albus TaxID=272210 RepID=A0ABW3TKG5_9MICO
MPWSTRELAELAGVSLRAIRHWHDLGLLPDPARLSNGYKQYTGQHLVLVLRIKRLTGLGFGLDRVAEMLRPELTSTHETDRHTAQGNGADRSAAALALLADLRGELDARIAELTAVRAEVDTLLLGSSPLDLAPPAAAVYGALLGGQSAPDRVVTTAAGTADGAYAARVNRDLAILLGHLTPAHYIATIAETIADLPAEMHRLEREVMRLPANASAAEVARLATELAAAMRTFITEHPNHAALSEIESGAALDVPLVTELAFEALNTAQQQVMTRVMAALADLA